MNINKPTLLKLQHWHTVSCSKISSKNNSLNKKRKKHLTMVAPKINATSGIFVFFSIFLHSCLQRLKRVPVLVQIHSEIFVDSSGYEDAIQEADRIEQLKRNQSIVESCLILMDVFCWSSNPKIRFRKASCLTKKSQMVSNYSNMTKNNLPGKVGEKRMWLTGIPTASGRQGMPPSAEEQTVQEPSSTSFPCLQAQNAEIPYPTDISMSELVPVVF